jgi:hypothetical protein
MNLATKQREYLLHRAMSGEEFLNNSEAGVMNHPYNMSSWTPHHEAAKGHTEDNDKQVVSAWIPESHIHYIVPQIGEQHTKKPFTSSSYAWEHEVIVKPNHNSQIHHEDDSIQKSESAVLDKAREALKVQEDENDDLLDIPDHVIIRAATHRWK